MTGELEPRRDPPPPARPVVPVEPGVASGLSRGRKLLAFAIALASDALSLPAELSPPVQWLIDGATAALLFAVLGFRWTLLPVLAVECVPVLGMFPTWTLAVGALVMTTPTRASDS